MEKKLVYGIGVYEVGKYAANINGKRTNEYSIWTNMIRRCYSEENQVKYPTYKDCIICDAWLNFQTFAEWYNNNHYSLENERVAIDKDILIKGNKIYSPETCIFVPQSINALLLKRNSKRGIYPIGVRIKNNKYEARVNKDGQDIHIGCFKTIGEAFEKYAIHKRIIIIEVLQRYKDIIPYDVYLKLFDVLAKYEVDIND